MSDYPPGAYILFSYIYKVFTNFETFYHIEARLLSLSLSQD